MKKVFPSTRTQGLYSRPFALVEIESMKANLCTVFKIKSLLPLVSITVKFSICVEGFGFVVLPGGIGIAEIILNKYIMYMMVK